MALCVFVAVADSVYYAKKLIRSIKYHSKI